ncbi:hypothetical protein GIB67_016236 [Kingdonia uniflora]|uniref:Uncharacterized protein n=1 Tax=Kingdonia uniflora TaxID=39325 RepID=A0A7J7LT81_9MAGN|nr:hypothetical protein GIB67_016236 [Kingdonia uniflora]
MSFGAAFGSELTVGDGRSLTRLSKMVGATLLPVSNIGVFDLASLSTGRRTNGVSVSPVFAVVLQSSDLVKCWFIQRFQFDETIDEGMEQASKAFGGQEDLGFGKSCLGSFGFYATGNEYCTTVNRAIRAMKEGDLVTTKMILDGRPSAVRMGITSSGETTLFKTSLSKNLPFVKELVHIRDNHELLPLVVSATNGNKDMVHYLYDKTSKEELKPETSKTGLILSLFQL